MLLRLLIRSYQLFISPLLGVNCRFTPTCSHYGMEALRVHGVIRGSYLTVMRVLRCNPFANFGHDPVPPSHTK